MKKLILITSLFLLQIAFFENSQAQTLPVGTPVLEEYYRLQQLQGKLDSNISFAIRPINPKVLSPDKNVFYPEDADKGSSGTLYNKGALLFQLLPLQTIQQFNSHHPYGWNDGLMIPAKGYQTFFSGGVYFKYGPLSIQFRPEYVYAANPSFPGYASGHGDQDLSAYYGYHNLIDAPERLSDGSYSKFNLGQSSIRLTFGPVSFGLSNENLWWGPGVRNSIVLTNNAPGFKHVTINTVRPIRTPVGSFEFQVIGARLDNTNRAPLDVTTTSIGTNLYNPKRSDWRYYSGFNINYQPKWLPGLFLGLTRAFDAYHSDIKGFNAYVPFFTPYQKVNDNGGTGDAFDRDQVTSLYGRWLFTKAKAEVYFEYGLNDNSYNLSDFLGSPEHSRAYVAGISKYIPLAGRKDQGILFNTEITQLSQTVDRLVRDAGGWYIHSGVRQGMTNMGQVIGAGTGSGGNLQSFDVSWVSGLKKLGFMFERYEHNVDFQNYYFGPINGNSRKWVDLGLALKGNWDYQHFLFTAKLEGVKSLNYQWILKNYTNSDYYVPNNDVFNLHLQLGAIYRF
ncbi:capsule assembly Wzi family protein [Mucilaginibacter sp. RS28]|uniref:Capsule assembly Wzi family protein n=1 Tax=Mucilaginibacter straminoryzae TaxID=2932774 RepID=A0A9X2B8W0_9SPHI|nr:capsule assembly Wzi family protein [Mucilaginibacter straminoryzae]MCJ8209806.1 capsule assembly Wzi family protein [Mucilaginibacter straminoryzae]